MADIDQIKLIKKGIEVWNRWVYDKKPRGVEIDLSGANLSGARLSGAELRGADLSGAKLTGTFFLRAKLDGADLRGADLSGALLYGASLDSARVSGADLRKADIRKVFGRFISLNKANLEGADLSGADLSGAKMRGANLTGADMSGAQLTGADLRGAKLAGTNLQYAILIVTNLNEAILNDCKIYGISAWGLKGVPAIQSSLVITNDREVEITVDDLQVAQFIYLLLNNKNVRHVIDTITSKAVLILGRFTPERKEVLDLIRVELRKHNYVPILFDFENTSNQSLMETVMILAGMARFVIADITTATMVREELRSVVEKYPAKPVQPILLNGEQEYVTLPEMRSSFKNILPTFTYKDDSEVVSKLSKGIVTPAENWLKARKSQILSGDKTDREIALEIENEALKKRLREKSM